MGRAIRGIPLQASIGAAASVAERICRASAVASGVLARNGI